MIVYGYDEGEIIFHEGQLKGEKLYVKLQGNIIGETTGEQNG